MVNIKKFQQDLTHQNYNTAAALGFIAGTKPDDKFGFSVSITAGIKDIWPFDAAYTFPVDGGQPLELVSDAADDQQITCVLVDAVTGLERSVIVALSGTGGVPVAIPGSDSLAVNRAYNSDSTPFAGNVDIQGTGAPNANTFARLLAVDQQTLQLPYMVPSDKIMVIEFWDASINKSIGANESVIFAVRARYPNKIFRVRKRFGLIRDGTSDSPKPVRSRLVLPASTQVRLTADPDTGPISASGVYQFKLYDVNLFTTAFLEALELS